MSLGFSQNLSYLSKISQNLIDSLRFSQNPPGSPNLPNPLKFSQKLSYSLRNSQNPSDSLSFSFSQVPTEISDTLRFPPVLPNLEFLQNLSNLSESFRFSPDFTKSFRFSTPLKFSQILTENLKFPPIFTSPLEPQIFL